MDAFVSLIALRALEVKVAVDRPRFCPRDRVAALEVYALRARRAAIFALLAAEQVEYGGAARGCSIVGYSSPRGQHDVACHPEHRRPADDKHRPGSETSVLARGGDSGISRRRQRLGVPPSSPADRTVAVPPSVGSDDRVDVVIEPHHAAPRSSGTEAPGCASCLDLSMDTLIAALRERDAQMYVDGDGRLHLVGRPLAPDDPIRVMVARHRSLLTEWFTYAPNGRCAADGCYRLRDGDSTCCPDHAQSHQVEHGRSADHRPEGE